MSSVRLFPSYVQRENQTTNHCLLLLKILYEANPDFLSTAIANLLDSELDIAVGVSFSQQKRSGRSIPDGTITQKPFTIIIETKHGNEFEEPQLRGHIEGLQNEQGEKVLIALGSSEQDDIFHPSLTEAQKFAEGKGIKFIARTFEQFLAALRIEHLPKNVEDAISDLTSYLDEHSLLPQWKYRLDVVNCTLSMPHIIEHGVYVCPTVGSAYRHRRSLYFGAYQNKIVHRVARIIAVVDFDKEPSQISRLWSNGDNSDLELLAMAKDRCEKIRHPFYPVRVFLLDTAYETSFTKDSYGGMQSSKQYFDIRSLNVSNAEDLAQKLRDMNWTTLTSR